MKRLATAATLVFFALVGSAQGRAELLVGPTYSHPYQQFIDASQVPTTDNLVVVREKPCDYLSGRYGMECILPEPIDVDPTAPLPEVKTALFVGLGRIFDKRYLTDANQAEINSRVKRQMTAEDFQAFYARCALERPPTAGQLKKQRAKAKRGNRKAAKRLRALRRDRTLFSACPIIQSAYADGAEAP